MALALPQAIRAQATEALVTYTEQLVFQPDSAQMADPRYQQMMAMWQNPPVFKKLLRISPQATLYLSDPVEMATPINPSDPQARMKMMMRQENEVYRQLDSNVVVESSDLMGKKFLITGDEPRRWKIGSEMRMIAGYPCLKATATDSLGTTEAWFSTALPVPSGPRNLGGLPGLVLEAKLRNGRLLVTAQSVEMRPLGPEEPVARPDKGKPVTRQEYRAIVKEKMDEMKQNGGGAPWMRMGL